VEKTHNGSSDLETLAAYDIADQYPIRIPIDGRISGMSDSRPPWIDLLSDGKLDPLTGDVFAYDFGAAVEPSSSLRCVMMFHIGVWLSRTSYKNFSIVAPVSSDRAMQELHQTAQYILFGDRTAYKDFMKWMRRYQKHFVREPMTKTFLPRMASSGTAIRLHYICTKFSTQFDPAFLNIRLDDEMFEMWCWVDQNVSGKIYCATDGVFAFSKTADAVAFKLRWG
jgi:hypothetical protein